MAIKVCIFFRPSSLSISIRLYGQHIYCVNSEHMDTKYILITYINGIISSASALHYLHMPVAAAAATATIFY